MSKQVLFFSTLIFFASCKKGSEYSILDKNGVSSRLVLYEDSTFSKYLLLNGEEREYIGTWKGKNDTVLTLTTALIDGPPLSDVREDYYSFYGDSLLKIYPNFPLHYEW